MKKFILFLMTLVVLLVVTSPAVAQFNWVTANQGSFMWDAVELDPDGDPWPAGTHVEYTSYYVNSVADPTKTSPIVVEQTTLLRSTVTLPGKGRYLVGVTAHLVDDTSGELLETSDFAWSDVPEDCMNGETFGFQLFGGVGAPGSLRVSIQ